MMLESDGGLVKGRGGGWQRKEEVLPALFHFIIYSRNVDCYMVLVVSVVVVFTMSVYLLSKVLFPWLPSAYNYYYYYEI